MLVRAEESRRSEKYNIFPKYVRLRRPESSYSGTNKGGVLRRRAMSVGGHH